jgi:RHS repeat-associated protein
VVAIRDIAHPTGAVTDKYQHTDALGSPVAVTNAAGAVIERSDYEPWGAIIGQPNRNGIGYTGHMMDGATGLTYMQQRYYDQSIGRFLSIDPVSAEASTGEHFNRYWYADGNPYKYTDPDGRAVKAIAAAVVACRLISTCRQAVGRTVARAARTVRDAINSRRGTLQRDLPQNKPEPPKGNPHAPGDAPNETVIVRGGVGEKPPTGSTYSGSQGRTIEEAGRGVPNGQVRETTAGRIRESGGEVEVKPEVRPKTGETNYQHVNVREGGRESTLSDVKPNPAPKDQRVK